METSWCEDLDGQAAADALVVNHAGLVADEARELAMFAHWADLHSPDSQSPDGPPAGGGRPGTERAKSYGGHGTPQVLEFAVVELGVLLGVGTGTAVHLIRDALDLRDRHPSLWSRMQAASRADAADADPAQAVGFPRVWQARQVAYACHKAGLTLEQARWVDAQTTPRLGHCNWSRFETELAGAIIEVDPKAAKAREHAEKLRRYVTTGRTNEHGLTTMIAKIDAGDAIVFTAMCNTIADFLKQDGDTSSADERRSKAYGILGNPAHAVAFLVAHGFGVPAETPADQRDPEADPETETPDAGNPDAPEHSDDNSGGQQHTGDHHDDDAGANGNPDPRDDTDSSRHQDANDPTDDGLTDEHEETTGASDASGASGRPGNVVDLFGNDGGQPTSTPPTPGGPAAGDEPGSQPGSELLDRFDSRRIDPHEGTQPPGGRPEDVPGPEQWRSRRNHDYHHREPDPELHPEPDPEPAPQHRVDDRHARPPDEAPEPAHATDRGLRPDDLHPSLDDSDDPDDPGHPRASHTSNASGGANSCPNCGQKPAPQAQRENSAQDPPLSRPAAAIAQLAATGLLDKITSIDPALLRPKAVLYLHLDESSFTRDAGGAARFEHGIGPVTPERAIQVLGHHHVDVKPVIDLANQTPADAHQIPARLREALHLAMPGSVFPWAAYTGQTKDDQDADHTIPYVPGSAGGAPGQTRLDNLGFLGRTHHRVKTFAPGWIHRQPRQGVHLWRSRHGYWWQVDRSGTHPLGKHPDLSAYGPDIAQLATPDGPKTANPGSSPEGAARPERIKTVQVSATALRTTPSALEEHLAKLIAGHTG